MVDPNLETRQVDPSDLVIATSLITQALYVKDETVRVAMLLAVALDWEELTTKLLGGKISMEIAPKVMHDLSLLAAEAAMDVIRDGIPTEVKIHGPEL